MTYTELQDRICETLQRQHSYHLPLHLFDPYRAFGHKLYREFIRWCTLNGVNVERNKIMTTFSRWPKNKQRGTYIWPE